MEQPWLDQKFPNPNILNHPNIPKPLHGLSPRVVKGDVWWDQTRKDAYARHGYRCAACGVPKSEAAWHKWLEGHEIYRFDYFAGSMVFDRVEPLCHACHVFIHSGRLEKVVEKSNDMPLFKALAILYHGFSVLKKEGIKPSYQTSLVYLRMRYPKEPPSYHKKILTSRGIFPPAKLRALPNWPDWYLEIDGEKFYSKFLSQSDWEREYLGGWN